jgi:hypothetical protein
VTRRSKGNQVQAKQHPVPEAKVGDHPLAFLHPVSGLSAEKLLKFAVHRVQKNYY